LLNDAKRPKWLSIFVWSLPFFGVLIISNILAVELFGFQILQQYSYFFGNNLLTNLGVLFFIEGGILVALGSLWSLGSSENVSYGMYRKNYGSFSKEDWEDRKKLTENGGRTIKILLIVGGLTLIIAIILVFI
jgi:hypothetical protein